jgi:ferredoxin
LKYGTPHLHKNKRETETDSSRRSFLLSSALLTTAALAQEKKVFDGGYIDLEDKVAPERQTPLTPPGSLSAQHFANHCTGCQLCVSDCPNDVLRPSTDLMHFMQPTMSYEHGYCRPECTRCSEVCPAGAIKPIDREEKASIQIGHAVWVKKNCVPLTDNVECGNCARHCPTGAIEMVPLDENDEESPYIPAINENACIGCGACEYVCPARPFSAIYVEGHEVHKTI